MASAQGRGVRLVCPMWGKRRLLEAAPQNPAPSPKMTDMPVQTGDSKVTVQQGGWLLTASLEIREFNSKSESLRHIEELRENVLGVTAFTAVTPSDILETHSGKRYCLPVG